MNLNHISLPVDDVAVPTTFFETYFDFKCVDQKGDNLLAILIGENNFTLVLMSETFNKNRNSSYPDAFHLGFLVDSKEAFLAKFQQLMEGNINLNGEPHSTPGVFGFYFHAPGSILVEVSTTK